MWRWVEGLLVVLRSCCRGFLRCMEDSLLQDVGHVAAIQAFNVIALIAICMESEPVSQFPNPSKNAARSDPTPSLAVNASPESEQGESSAKGTPRLIKPSTQLRPHLPTILPLFFLLVANPGWAPTLLAPRAAPRPRTSTPRPPPLALFPKTLNRPHHLLPTSLRIDAPPPQTHAHLIPIVDLQKPLHEQLLHVRAHEHTAVTSVLLLRRIAHRHKAELFP